MNAKQKKDFLRGKLERGRDRQSVSGEGWDKLFVNGESIDLTGQDVVKICEGQVKVVPYHELGGFDSIEQLLQPYGAVIILYETTRADFGHYTALYYNNTNELEFFDSYGFKPDAELPYAQFDKVPYLTQLLAKYNKPYDYNKVRLQEWEKDVNTCGRWTSLRVRTRKLYSLAEFQKLFQSNRYYNGDWYATALTYLYTLR